MALSGFGEIFVCRFPFTSGQFSKPRPVLVLFDLGVDVVICRTTSAAHSSSFDVPIREWHEAGWAKPSVAPLNRLVTAESSLLASWLGELSTADAVAVKAPWNEFMTL